jgi:hypothetical protein
MTAAWVDVELIKPNERNSGKPTVKLNATIEILKINFILGIFFLKNIKYIKDSTPANADLPKVINSGERALLLNPNAIFVAGGVIEKIKIPINPNKRLLFSLLYLL